MIAGRRFFAGERRIGPSERYYHARCRVDISVAVI